MKKIIEFSKKNKAISIFGVVAFGISISYAITYNMPDYFGIEPYYALANNICISYIAALIFFVVQVYIPERRNHRKCMEILKNKFDDLTKFNEVAVLFFEKHIKINERGAKIYWNGDDEKIYLKAVPSDVSRGTHISRYTKTELLNWKKTFDSKLNVIKETAVINYCDYEILDKISELEKQNFYSSLAYVIEWADTDIDFKSIVDGVKEFKRINEELKELCSIFEHYQLMDVTQEDMLRIDAIYNNVANNSLSLQSINREIMKRTIKEGLKKEGMVLSEPDLEKVCDMVMSSKQSTE